MITAKELAEKLNGRAYGDSFNDVKQEAKESGLVIVYGASDDLMEFDGALYDEGGCFDGGRVYFDRNGVDQEGDDVCRRQRQMCIRDRHKGHFPML